MNFLFFINPTAGKGDMQDSIAERIKEHFKDKVDNFRIHFTKEPGDAGVVAKEEAEKGEPVRMFACGGEGTVFEVLNGIVGYDNVELGVIPCGSANDFLKFFDSKSPFLDIAAQTEGESVKMDIIKADDKYCLNGCSVGMDAMVAHDMQLFKNWPLVSGPMAYKLAIVKTFLKKIGVSIKISVDGKKAQLCRCLFAVVANAPYYGGGYKSAPKAVPFDGKLDFTMVDVIGKLKVPKFLSVYEKGQHEKLEYCHISNCNTMEFWSDKPVPVNLDGEIVETTHMMFSIVKSAVKFIVPKGICDKLSLKTF